MYDHPIGTQETPANLILVRIVWGMMMFSVILSIVLAYAASLDSDSDFANPEPLTQMSSHEWAVIGGFTFVAVFALMLSVIVPRILAARKRKTLKTEILEMLTRDELADATVTPVLVRLGFVEVVVFAGLFVVFSIKNPVLIHPFAIVSVLAFVFSFPSLGRLRRLLA